MAKFVIRPERIVFWLSITALSLGAIHLFMVYLRRAHDRDFVMGLAPLFDFAQENNFPSYFSALLLLAAAALLAVIGFSAIESLRKHRVYWLVLAIIFAFLSCDELLAIHERLMAPTREALNTTGLLYAAWIIPYLAVLLVLGLVYLRWFLALSRTTQLRFFLSAGLFLVGAVVLEALSGAEVEVHRSRTLLLDVYIFLEDAFEMAGVIVFIRALLLELRASNVSFVFYNVSE